jgi:ketosteroid isomerase-like protein
MTRNFLAVTVLLTSLWTGGTGLVGAAETAAAAAKDITDEFGKVECVDPTACCKEAEKVLEVLQLLVKAYATGDLKTYETYLDDHCTTFDENTKRVLHGKQAVLTELKTIFAEHAADGIKPLKTFTIDQPYAKVHGDTCVVTFVATKELGGEHPIKQKAHVTDIFIKRGDTWKKLHWRGRWTKVKE